MENKIQALTDKLYKEGVEKGNNKAAEIVAEAQAKADAIIAEAQAKADAMIAQAKKQCQETEKNTKSELKLYTAQAVNAMRSEIANVLTDKIVSGNVKEFTEEDDFFCQFIVNLAKNWSANEPIEIDSADAIRLKGYFMKNANDLLDKGVTINQVSGVKTLCTIKPANGSYKVEFGEEEFENYFKAFLRPQLIETLF